ncbi:MAG: hypothetical protein WC848_00765 [Parcubacteria group bacterium]|jgi:hypothetical protein
MKDENSTGNKGPERILKIGHNMYTTLEAQQLKARIKSPDLMDIEPITAGELIEQPKEKTQSPAKKRRKKYFNGRGPFSKINQLTTTIGMINAVTNHGLGGDGFSAIRSSEIAQGVSEYYKIATDLNYGKIK